jgi:hypothetical protein
MKRIIIEQGKTVSISEVDDNSFVGIEWESGSKCMIINTTEGYCGMSDEYKPSLLSVWTTDSIQEYVRRALNQGNNKNSKAFAFNNIKELFEWMSK